MIHKTRVFRLGNLTATMLLGDALEILPTLSGYDHVIADPPFSARTHDGHDVSGQSEFGNDGSSRSTITYLAWTATEVRAVCQLLPKTGWCCFLTDHTLGRDWERELQAVGRYVFAPLPLVTRGRSVRLCGDGPSSWTDWLIVARTKAEAKWGTLPGFYEGAAGQIQHMGGKPLNAMCRIVEDYSREGQTVLDICAGAATTLIAALRMRRNAIGIEVSREHFETACERLERECRQGVLAFV